ncbi:uncharacterized protein CIMG_11204 [Coccidioides immitis RS]|uniref:Uncharacterized protein n=1 Tax=Coccidioides immitis (strain RS) TaxID=246410 RepID=A0A0D8JW73_COCIM|nr:uncharacterized protein CIMG_11204 [Coccidioides immitis RS]KJF61567.1 hypothetical protein CIMG_11204 [Coccidioides immitis RS]
MMFLYVQECMLGCSVFEFFTEKGLAVRSNTASPRLVTRTSHRKAKHPAEICRGNGASRQLTVATGKSRDIPADPLAEEHTYVRVTNTEGHEPERSRQWGRCGRRELATTQQIRPDLNAPGRRSDPWAGDGHREKPYLQPHARVPKTKVKPQKG